MARYGLQEVYKGDNAAVDIVFVHGLRGSSQATWTKDGVLWPRDLLAKDIEDSRIFLFGYDSSITRRDQARLTQTKLEYDTLDLCAKLVAERSNTDTAERPLIFVAHSLGGLLCAEAMVQGTQRASGDHAHLIAQYTRGLIFLGTPFQGSKGSKPAEFVRRILSAVGFDTHDKTLKLLGADSERLAVLNTVFPECMRKRISSKRPGDRIHAMFFFERLKTFGVMVVEPESAQLPGCGESAPINADHLNICKFKTPQDEGYNLIVSTIRKFKAECEPVEDNAAGDRHIYNYGKAVNIGSGTMNFGDQHITL